jgi:hypothetical protein
MDDDSDYEFEGDYDKVEEALVGDFRIKDSEELENLDNHTLANYLINQSVPEEMLACLEEQNSASSTASGRLALQELSDYIKGGKKSETLDDDEYETSRKVDYDSDSDSDDDDDDDDDDDKLVVEDITDRNWKDLLMNMSVEELKTKKLTKMSVLIDYIKDETGQTPELSELKALVKKIPKLKRRFGKMLERSFGYQEPSLSGIKRNYVGPGGGVSKYGRRRSKKKGLSENQNNASIVMKHYQKTRKSDPEYTLKNAWDDFKDGNINQPRSKRTRGRSSKKTTRRRSRRTKRTKSVPKIRRRRRRSKKTSDEYGPTYDWVDRSYKIF